MQPSQDGGPNSRQAPKIAAKLLRIPMALVCEIDQSVHGNYEQAQAFLEALCFKECLPRPVLLAGRCHPPCQKSHFPAFKPSFRSYVPSLVWRHAAETLTQDRLNTLFDIPTMAAIRQSQLNSPRLPATGKAAGALMHRPKSLLKHARKGPLSTSKL